jgi:hypothetical protein
MNHDDHDDHDAADLRSLASLPSLAPSDIRQRRVRSRCHAALAGERRAETGLAPRLLDAALVAAAGIYLAAVLTEAVRLVSAG